MTQPEWAFEPIQTSRTLDYANGVQIAFSQWDFVFHFSQLAMGPGVASGAEPSVTQSHVAQLVMSPQHTRALLTILSQNIAAYEEQFGAIPNLLAPNPEVG